MTDETQPLIPCVCCGHVMEAKFQAALYPGARSYYLVTCLSPLCVLQGFTLADCSYPPPELDVYLESGRKRLAKLEVAAV